VYVQMFSVEQQYNMCMCRCSVLSNSIMRVSAIVKLGTKHVLWKHITSSTTAGEKRIFHKFQVYDILKWLLEMEREDKTFCKINPSCIYHNRNVSKHPLKIEWILDIDGWQRINFNITATFTCNWHNKTETSTY